MLTEDEKKTQEYVVSMVRISFDVNDSNLVDTTKKLSDMSHMLPSLHSEVTQSILSSTEVTEGGTAM